MLQGEDKKASLNLNNETDLKESTGEINLLNGFYEALITVTYNNISKNERESVRIVKDGTSTLNIALSKLLEASFVIEISDDIEATPDITLKSSKSGGGFDLRYNISASISGYGKEYSNKWELNGAECVGETSKKLSLTFDDLKEGTNNVRYIMITPDGDTIWSRSINVVRELKNPVLTKSEILSEGIDLNSSRIIAIRDLDPEKYYLLELPEKTGSGSMYTSNGSSYGTICEVSWQTESKKYILFPDSEGRIQFDTGYINTLGQYTVKECSYDTSSKIDTAIEEPLGVTTTGEYYYFKVCQIDVSSIADRSRVGFSWAGSNYWSSAFVVGSYELHQRDIFDLYADLSDYEKSLLHSILV